jgi:hypothetical protein
MFFSLAKMGTFANNSLDLPQGSVIDFFRGVLKNKKMSKVSILKAGLNHQRKNL